MSLVEQIVYELSAFEIIVYSSPAISTFSLPSETAAKKPSLTSSVTSAPYVLSVTVPAASKFTVPISVPSAMRYVPSPVSVTV